MSSKCGFVAIVGRPNVGKSTLLNKIVREKISITANKPQTTRNNILGIRTIDNSQAVFVDTPGIHKVNTKAINKAMNKSAFSALSDVDLVLFVIDALKWTDEDEMVLNRLKELDPKIPVFLIANKVDRIKEKDKLFPVLENLSEKFNFSEIIPTSALRDNINKIKRIEDIIFNLLPDSPNYFDKNQVTDKDLSFRLSEIIREKLTRTLGKEIPYALTSQIEAIKKGNDSYTVYGIIWVEKDSQKQIVIGSRGAKIKEVGISARIDMEKVLDKKVNLKLWVKVKSGWSDNTKYLQELGLMDAS